MAVLLSLSQTAYVTLLTPLRIKPETDSVICAAITSKLNKAKLPTHIELDAKKYGLVKDSVILLEQLRTIDKQRLKDKVCHLDTEIMKQVNNSLLVSLELDKDEL